MYLGVGLFEAVLALALLGVLVLGATVFFETRALEKRGRLAAVQLSVLAEAAASHAHSRFPALLALAQVGPSELTLAALKASGSLTAEFSETDALGRGYRVLMLAAGTEAFDLLVTETVRAGDTVRAAAALLEAPGPGVGLAGASRLSGPTVDADLGAFRAAFAGAPAEGALAALRRFDHGSVYGDALYRVAIPGFAEANRMDTDLDMGGNAIERAGRIEAASLEVETDLEAGGDLTVTGTCWWAARCAPRARSRRRFGSLPRPPHRGSGRERRDDGIGRNARRDGGGLGARRGGLDRRRRVGGCRECAPGRSRRRHCDGPDGNRGHGLGVTGVGRADALRRTPRCRQRRVLAPHRRPVHGVPVMSAVSSAHVGRGAACVAAMVLLWTWAAPVAPAAGQDGAAWNAERAFVALENLRTEIGLLRGLAAAQAALLAWNGERADSGAGPAVLPAALCADERLAAWCRALPATFGTEAARATGGGQGE